MDQTPTQPSKTWANAKRVIRTLSDTAQRERMEYILYQKQMTPQELHIFHVFAMYLREKQSIEAHMQKNMTSIIDSFVHVITKK